MQISTVGDALGALAQLDNDIANVMQNVVNAQASSNWFVAQINGSDAVAASSISILQGLLDYSNRINSEIQGLPIDTPLTNQQIAQLSELQKEVIADRSEVNNDISSVNWTLGGVFADATTQIENWGTAAVTDVSSSLGINWTLVALGIGALVVFLVWMRR